MNYSQLLNLQKLKNDGVADYSVNWHDLYKVPNEILEETKGVSLVESFLTSSLINEEMQISVKNNDYSNIKADLSSLGLGSAVPATSCVNTYINEYLCKWKDQELNIGQDKTVLIPFSISDIYGNTAVRSFSKILKIDGTPPVATYIGTEDSYEGVG